jgi:hypothetical protein
MPKFTHATSAAAGRRGGETTVKRHGVEHMQAIGRRGFQVTTGRHFQGNATKCIEHIRTQRTLEPRRKDNA